MGLSPFSQTQTSGGVYSGVSVMLGSRLSLERLAEWIKWQAWAVQSSLWVDGALAIAEQGSLIYLGATVPPPPSQDPCRRTLCVRTQSVQPGQPSRNAGSGMLE